MNEKEIGNKLQGLISIGDDREKVENTLKDLKLSGTQKLEFSYDQIMNRYQATVVDESRCGKFQGIGIYIPLDKAGAVQRIDVHKFYTAP